VRREVLYNILIEFGVPMNPVRLIKMCLNGTCSKVGIGKHLAETTVTNRILIQEEINRRLYSGNACYRSVQNLRPSRLLSKNVKTRIYKTIIMPVVLYGCETWYLTLREEHRLRVYENRVLRRIFGPKRDEVMGE
jgi:hypothetical protein